MAKCSASQIGEICDVLPCALLLLSCINYLGPELLQTTGWLINSLSYFVQFLLQYFAMYIQFHLYVY
jgi:hypothetical protein